MPSTQNQIKVFFLQPTDLYVRGLRRYEDRACPKGGPKTWCSCSVEIDTIKCTEAPTSGEVSWPRDDVRWPTACKACGNTFGNKACYLVDHDRVYRRSDNGDHVTLRNAPAGSCWDATWYRDFPEYIGPDGRTLVVKLPDGHTWMIDQRASNCTRKDDNTHKCWVRHGKPEDGTLHVDKNGDTCAAGAGSILTPNWHGFLHNGYLRQC